MKGSSAWIGPQRFLCTAVWGSPGEPPAETQECLDNGMPGYISTPQESSQWGPAYSPVGHLVVSPQSLADNITFFPLFFFFQWFIFYSSGKEIWKGRKQWDSEGVLNLRGGYIGKFLVMEACFKWLAAATELRYRSLGYLGHRTASNTFVFPWAEEPVQPTHACGGTPQDPTHLCMAGQLVNGS